MKYLKKYLLVNMEDPNGGGSIVSRLKRMNWQCWALPSMGLVVAEIPDDVELVQVEISETFDVLDKDTGQRLGEYSHPDWDGDRSLFLIDQAELPDDEELEELALLTDEEMELLSKDARRVDARWGDEVVDME